MITSARTAVTDALHTLITTAVAGQAKVILGAPHPDDTTPGSRAVVWLPLADAAASHRQSYALTGLTAKAEEWDVEVVVFTQTLGGDAGSARTRFDAVLDPILAAVAADPRLGGVAELVQVTGVNIQEASADRHTRQLGAVVTVHVSAWLT